LEFRIRIVAQKRTDAQVISEVALQLFRTVVHHQNAVSSTLRIRISKAYYNVNRRQQENVDEQT